MLYFLFCLKMVALYAYCVPTKIKTKAWQHFGKIVSRGLACYYPQHLHKFLSGPQFPYL